MRLSAERTVVQTAAKRRASDRAQVRSAGVVGLRRAGSVPNLDATGARDQRARFVHPCQHLRLAKSHLLPGHRAGSNTRYAGESPSRDAASAGPAHAPQPVVDRDDPRWPRDALEKRC